MLGDGDAAAMIVLRRSSSGERSSGTRGCWSNREGGDLSDEAEDDGGEEGAGEAKTRRLRSGTMRLGVFSVSEAREDIDDCRDNATVLSRVTRRLERINGRTPPRAEGVGDGSGGAGVRSPPRREGDRGRRNGEDGPSEAAREWSEPRGLGDTGGAGLIVGCANIGRVERSKTGGDVGG